MNDPRKAYKGAKATAGAHKLVQRTLAKLLEDPNIDDTLLMVVEDHIHDASDLAREAEIAAGQIAAQHPEVLR